MPGIQALTSVPLPLFELTSVFISVFVDPVARSEFYAAKSADLGPAAKSARKIKAERPAVLVFDGTGDNLVPCVLDEGLILNQSTKTNDNFFCPYPHYTFYQPTESGRPPSAGIMDTSSIDAKQRIVNEAITKSHWDESSCALCNHQHCTCSWTEQSGSQQAVDSVSRLVSTSKYLGALAGKEFSYDNPKSQVLLMSYSFGGPLSGYFNSTDGEPQVKR